MNTFTHVFAEPGAGNIIDIVNPMTGTATAPRGGYSNETLTEIRKRYPAAEIVAYDDWKARKAAEQDTPIAWHECSWEVFDKMLNVLPPRIWSGGGFLVGEPYDHHAATGEPRFNGFCARFGKFYGSSRPMTAREFKEQMQTFKGGGAS